MIGVLTGKVLFSDGKEAVVQTQSGIGYQIFCHYILPEGGQSSVFVSHIVRETAELLFAFRTLREKKLFELLTTVKGVGPKSAYNIVCEIGVESVISAVSSDDKKALTKVSGVGTKAASQIVLDLQKKIQKIKIYSSEKLEFSFAEKTFVESHATAEKEGSAKQNLGLTTVVSQASETILSDTVLACENLGFHTDKVIPLAQKILKENEIQKTEQLVHLVLKEI